MSSSRNVLLASALGATLLFATSAMASPIQVRDGDGGSVFSGVGSVGLTINVNGSNKSVQAGAFALQYRFSSVEPWTNFLTYCLEADELLGISGTTPVSGDYLGDISAASEYAANADKLMRLYATWFLDSLTSATKSAAFQVALWELATDTGTTSLSSGNFKFTTTGLVLTQANDYLNPANWVGPGDLGVILRVGNQDLIMEGDGGTTSTDIPEPASLALFGLGLAGLLASRRRAPQG